MATYRNVDFRKKIRLRQPAANGDGRLIRLTRYHSIFVNLIHTLIGYGFFINTIIEPYILPAVTVGLRLRLLSDFLKNQTSDFGQPL